MRQFVKRQDSIGDIGPDDPVMAADITYGHIAEPLTFGPDPAHPAEQRNQDFTCLKHPALLGRGEIIIKMAGAGFSVAAEHLRHLPEHCPQPVEQARPVFHPDQRIGRADLKYRRKLGRAPRSSMAQVGDKVLATFEELITGHDAGPSAAVILDYVEMIVPMGDRSRRSTKA